MGSHPSDVSLLSINTEGIESWNQIFGGNDVDGGETVIETSSGEYLIGGSSSSFNPNGVSNVYLIKTLIPTEFVFESFGCDSIQSLVNNSFFYESGIYMDTLISQYGGDSIVIQNVTVNQNPDNTLIMGYNDVTPSTLHYYQIINTTENNSEWNVEGGSIFQNLGNIIEVLWGNEGLGIVEFIEIDSLGCSTINTLEVTISDESTSIDELTYSRKLIKTINVLGNEITPKSNTILLQFYDDGTVEKKLIIE